MWTLIHAYDSKDEVDQVLNYYLEFFKTVGSDDVTKYDKMGGIQGSRKSFLVSSIRRPCSKIVCPF